MLIPIFQKLKINLITIFEFILIVILGIMYKDTIPLWVKEWSNFDSFYGLGFFVIGFNIYFLKANFEKLKHTAKSPSVVGFILILISMLLYIIGVKGSMDYLIGLSLPILLSGIVLSLYGIKLLNKLILPILFLGLIIPIFPLYRATMPLQMISTKISSLVLMSLGLNSFTEGNIIYVNQFRLAVVTGCSGLKSITSLLFVSIICSYLENSKYQQYLIYILLAIALAIGMNIIRIVITALYGLYNGNVGLEQFHNGIGIVINIISILVLIFIIRSNEKKSKIL